MNFLFHKVSEKQKEEIKKQAKEIMDKFSARISKISKNLDETYEEAEFYREEAGKKNSNFSKKIMFENAPDKNKDFIIAEKGKW